jgi:hypothetical protein
MVDEDWRPEFTGGFTRSRFYRHAALDGAHQRLLVALAGTDAAGRRGGFSPILELAGSDDRLPRLSDDAFVRRFVARQVTTGCRGHRRLQQRHQLPGARPGPAAR